jgi:Tfp pilus assembly protein PilF
MTHTPNPFAHARNVLHASLALAALLMIACVSPPPTAGVAEVMDRPAERALLSGLRLYDDALYPEAEKALNEALRLKLASPRDRAITHKTLAFIYCTTERATECEAAFRSAKLADPQFALSKAEAGHPVWGPVYAKSRR